MNLCLSKGGMCFRAGKASQGPSAALTGYVGREMGRVEALLKVVGSRPDNLVDNFFTLLPSGTAADFQRILDIKVQLLLQLPKLKQNIIMHV